MFDMGGHWSATVAAISRVLYQVVGYYVTIGSVQVMGFFDVAARLSAGDGPEKCY